MPPGGRTDHRARRSWDHASPPVPAVAIYGSFRYGQYFEDLLAGVVSAADAAGSSVISIQASHGVLPSGHELGGQQAVSRVAWDHVDAAIVILRTVSSEYIAGLRAAGKFVVAIGPERRGADAVVVLDNAGGVREAVSHLAGHGHTRIGFISPGWQADAAERYTAYAEELVRLGLSPGPQLGADLPRESSMGEQGYLAARQFLAGDRRCTAFVVAPDRVALGFARGLREAGLEIPGDVALVGVDDIDEAAVSAPPLATVAISFPQVGAKALEVALRGGRGEPTQERYQVPERFVPRESCGCAGGTAGSVGTGARTPEQALAAALIQSAREGVGLEDVDTEEIERLAGAVVDLLVNGGDQPEFAAVAGRLDPLCRLDRSVQVVLGAVRTLARDLAEPLAGGDPGRVWALSQAALDLCEAVRSRQLQRRMAEYVDLKRLQEDHYFVGTNLLGHDRHQLRSLGWLQQTPAQAGALGLWTPVGQTDQLTVKGVYERRTAAGDQAPPPRLDAPSRVEAFPPPWLLRDPAGRSRLVVVTQVRFEDADWGLLAVAGGRILQSSLVQETFCQWAILMSASLTAEKANADLARQAAELTTAYQTERALLEEVRVSEERHALAAEAAKDGLWDWDVASGTVFYSSQWKATLGFRDHEVGTSPEEWLDRVHPEDAAGVREQLDRVLAGVEQYLAVEHRLRSASGEDRWIACSGRSVLDDQGRPIRLVGSITDITVRRLLEDQLRQEARFDELTGLARANLLKDRLEQSIELARRRPGYRFAVVFIDLNDFKAVNDDFGHAAGDQLLISVAQRLEESLQGNETAARLGGDEFAVLLSDVDPVGQLPGVVARLQALVTAPHQVGSGTVTVGAAVGVALSDERYATADAMLHAADTAMYREKRRAKPSTLGGLSELPISSAGP